MSFFSTEFLPTNSSLNISTEGSFPLPWGPLRVHSSISTLGHLTKLRVTKSEMQLSTSLTVMGLGTAATTMPMGCGDKIAGLPLGRLGTPLLVALSNFLAGDSPGNGDCSFCSCCFFWILRCNCCFASIGEGRVFT